MQTVEWARETVHLPSSSTKLSTFRYFRFYIALAGKSGFNLIHSPASNLESGKPYAPRVEQAFQAAKCPFERYGVAFLKFDCVHTLSHSHGERRSEVR